MKIEFELEDNIGEGWDLDVELDGIEGFNFGVFKLLESLKRKCEEDKKVLVYKMKKVRILKFSVFGSNLKKNKK